VRRLTSGARRFHQTSLLLLLIALLLAPFGCKQRRKRVAPTSQDELLLSSMISTADPRSTAQLIKGFYPLEGSAWRWTAKDFTVSLSAPRDAAQKGAQLVLEFNIPDVAIQRLKSMTLSASVDGLKLAPETYTAAGTYSYIRDVPGDHLQAATIPVDFALDKVLPPAGAETRELGIIVTEVGFKIK
jgi:hypothetical protein